MVSMKGMTSAGAAASEDGVELEPAEEGVGDRAQAAHVVDVLGGGGDERVETLGLQHGGQSLTSMCIHRFHLKWGMTSRPKRSIASCISGTVLATKSRPESVVTPACW